MSSCQPVTLVRGTASVALPGDEPLLGDWIRTGYFQPDRIEWRFNRELGGTWIVTWALQTSAHTAGSYEVEISRLPGT